MSDTQLELLASLAAAMRTPVEVIRPEIGDLVDDKFATAMSNLLALHHALHEEPLNKKAFEYLFKNCLLAKGLGDARLNPSPGDESWDVEAGGVRWSLKTEAARGISRAQLRVEKFMEARWVRDISDADACARAVIERLPRHMSGYDRILVLRAFIEPGAAEYRLQEIPKIVLLRAFESAEPEDFAKRGASISFGADFYDLQGWKIFRILLDNSVEKVRLWYAASAAVTHGVWRIPIEATRAAQEAGMTH